jgi:hypothetical protein
VNRHSLRRQAPHEGNIQLTVAIPLHGSDKEDLISRARRMLARHHRDFKSALLHLYVKNANGRIGCSANLFTDNGRYHAYAEDWTVRNSVEQTLQAVHSQVLKHFERIGGYPKAMLRL